MGEQPAKKWKPKRRNTTCYRCGVFVAKPEREHAFPSSWYPETTPTSVQRPIVPACGPCNRTLGSAENRLGLLLSSSLPDTNAAGAGVRQRFNGAFERARGVDATDRDARRAKAESLYSHWRFVPADEENDGVTTRPAAHWLRTAGGVLARGNMAWDLPSEDVRLVTEKLVRAFFLLMTQRYLSPDAEIIGGLLKASQVDAAAQAIRAAALSGFVVPPGLVVRFAIAPGQPEVSVWYFAIWLHVGIHAFTRPRGSTFGE